MKNKITLLLPSVILTFFSFTGNAQLSDSIVGLNNYPVSSLYFCKIDIASGNLTNYQLITNNVSSLQSSCINKLTHEYYFCEGSLLTTIDAVSGNIISNINLPVSSTATFNSIKFNPCDSNLYGILYDSPTYSLARFDPAVGSMNIISVLSPGVMPCSGCMSVLDPDSGIYTMDLGNAVVGVDIYSGNVLYNTPQIDIPGESFGHIALKCSTHEIFGTSADVTAGIKYLSKIDPYTGVVTHVSNYGWIYGIWKPAWGGDCINQQTGDYFYSGSGGLLIRANTLTGNLVASHTVSAGELYFIDHFSSCECRNQTAAGIEDVKNETQFINNTFSDEITIHSNTNKVYEVAIYDMASRRILKKEFTNTLVIDTRNFNSGMYVYELKSKAGNSIKGKFLK